MAQRYTMTIDAGTGSGRAVIFDEKGRQISIGQEEWSHAGEDGVPNAMNFDCENNWKLLCRCIRSSIEKAAIDAKDIVAVTATSMREGIVLYDRNKREIFAVANVDARADKEVAQLKREFPELEREIYEKSGQTFALGAIPRLLWLKKNRPSIYEDVRYMNMISDWVLKKLSDTIVSEPSNAGTSGIFDLKKREWLPEAAAKAGLRDDIFPPVFESGEIVGEVTPRAARECGLDEGTLVVTGGGDVQLGSAGLGIVEAGEAAILGGTFWQQIVNIDGAKTDPDMDLRINPHVVKGLSQAEGITFFSGLVMRWFRDKFATEYKERAVTERSDPYTLLEEAASRTPVGSYGILPIFSDTMHYGRWYHAAPSFLNLPLDESIDLKGAMFRALEENAAIVSRLNLEAIFEFTGTDSDTITFAGGASKGDLWCRILSDVTGRRIVVPSVNEATALGGAFAAGTAAGIYDSIASAAKELVEWSKSYDPDMEKHEIYKDVAMKWKEAYSMQKKLVDEGITSAMWRAPGI